MEIKSITGLCKKWNYCNEKQIWKISGEQFLKKSKNCPDSACSAKSVLNVNEKTL